MKPFVSIFIVLCILCCAAVAGAELQAAVAFDAQNCIFTLEVSGLYADNPYFIMATRAQDVPQQALAEGNVLIADTLRADEAGKLSVAFAGINLLDANFYVGGIFAEDDSPYSVGQITSTEQKLPGSLSVIEPDAFQNTSFNSVHLGENVVFVGDRAFKDCVALFTVYVGGMNTAFGVDVFSGCPAALEIVCPEGSAAEMYAKENGIAFRNE